MEENMPEGWVETTLEYVTLVNPSIDVSLFPSSMLVSFVPMAAVEAGTGRMNGSTVRELSEVKKGYTAFQEGDILFAKITPCMENGKFAVAQSLSSRIGFGSTEFHVLRPENDINPHLIYYYLSQEYFKQLARVGMTGSAGQLRVPATFLREFSYPLAPAKEQNRIVSAIEQQFTRLDNAVASLKSAQARTKQYRASLLKAAVEGELTKEWRTEHPASETGTQLLTRILKERRTRWEGEQLAKMREKGIMPKDDKWKQAYKEPQEPDVKNLPVLPEGWCWATVEQLAAAEENSITDGPFGSNLKTEHYKESGPRVIRLQNIGDGFFRDEKAFISQDHFDKLRKHRIFAGDLVIAALGDNPPRSCIIPDFVGPAIVKADCIRYKVSPYVLNTYANIALNSEPTKKRTSAMLHGMGRPRLNLAEIKSIVIAIPPFAEQQCIMSEVEARLSNIAKLEEATEDNLKRAEHERQSILREAFAGRLVPQDPEDEPASVLLERIREERKKREEAEKLLRVDRKSAKMDIAKKRRSRKIGARQQELGLYKTLVEAGQPLPPEELFKRVGLDADEQSEAVEAFYEELHADVEDALIAETRPDYEHVLLEALEPSAEMQARVAKEEGAGQAQKAEQGEGTVDEPML